MQVSEFDEFRRLLSDTMAFYSKDVSRFALDVWWSACGPFALEQVRKAFTVHAMDPDRGQFAPRPADIVRVLHGTQTDRSLVAWGKVFDAMRSVGAWRSVVFDDGAIHAAISDLGGWPAICALDVEDLPFTQKRFCDLYRAYSAPGSGQHFPAKLAGRAELANTAAGYRSEPPVLIGDAEVCRRVLAGGVSGSKTAISVGDVLPAIERPRALACHE